MHRFRPFVLSSFPFDFLSFQLPFNHRTNYLLNQRLFIVFNERGAYLLKLKLTYKAVQIRSKYLWLLMYDLSNHSYDYRQMDDGKSCYLLIKAMTNFEKETRNWLHVFIKIKIRKNCFVLANSRSLDDTKQELNLVLNNRWR